MKNRRIIGAMAASIFILMLMFGSAAMAGNACPHAKSCVGDKAVCQKTCGQKSAEQGAKPCADKSKCTADCKGDGKCCPPGSACCDKAKDGQACCPSKDAQARCCPKVGEAPKGKPNADPGK